MPFWNKLGKIALTAAPYIAAPFTGGASLMATGLANKAVQKWSESDAKKAAAKGLAPSKFDDVLGKVGGYAGLASSFVPGSALGSIGMLGKAGNVAKAAGTASKFQGALKTGLGVASNLAGTGGGRAQSSDDYDYGGDSSDYIRNAISSLDRSYGGDDTPTIGSRQIPGNYGQPAAQNKKGGSSWIDKLGGVKGIAGIASGIGGAYAAKKLVDKYGGDNEVPQAQNYSPNPEPRDMGTNRFARQMRRQLGPVMGETNQNNPNLALSIGQGKMDAIRDQPFRGGYDVRTLQNYDEETGDPIYENTPMPTIGRQPRRRRQEAEY